MASSDLTHQLFCDILDDEIDTNMVHDKFKSNAKKLTSSINLNKKRKLIIKTPKKRKQSPTKYIIRNPYKLLNTPRFKYTTIKITDSLYYSIDKWGYVFLSSSDFIPHSYILCKTYVDENNNLQLLLDYELILSNHKHHLNEHIKSHMDDKLYKLLLKTNKQLSKSLKTQIVIPFCDFIYRYHIEYIINKHEVAIKILDKNNNDVGSKFIDEKLNIHTWVIHELERFDKNFLIDRLYYKLNQKNNEIIKLRRQIRHKNNIS
jgi:hypothetical protein